LNPFFLPDLIGWIGINLCKRVVEDQGGSIHVDSRLKKGTTITLTFQKIGAGNYAGKDFPRKPWKIIWIKYEKAIARERIQF